MNFLNYFYTLRSYVESYGGLIGRRFLPLVWVAAICVVIWFYGYLLAYGSFAPLAEAFNRIVAIVVVVAIWAVYMVVTTVRARKRDRELVDSLEKGAEAEAAASQQAEVGEIRDRLKQALALLRRITKKRFGYIYELPWYVIFGAPGSGKTTALSNSGLKFPLGDALGANSVQGVGGTRSCNWWFADEAILIDTAGRYTTQDDLNGSAKAGWEGFLSLLRKYRRSQPVNGALITLSIGDVLTREPEARLEELRAVRQRLSELDEYLGARVPVYLVLTKADLLTGFVEFFDGLNKTDREQVWGTTFGLEESYKAENLPERFLEEFGLLQERIGSMLIERLQQEPDGEIRGRIFRFPAQLASLKERLHEVLTELCASSKLVEAPLLRGVYFASGTQADELSMTKVQAGAPGLRRSYFLSRLFKEVIFNEASLVARDKRLSRRQMLLRRIAYGAAAVLALAVFTGWIATYLQNTRALAKAEEHINAYRQLADGIPVREVSDADFLRILPALNDIRDVTTDFDRGRRWTVSFGLDQRDKIASRQRESYQRALNGLLLPRMMVQLQKNLADTSDVRGTFDALKLYGMLGGLGPADPKFAAREAERMFAELYPGEGRTTVRNELVDHVARMVAGILPPMDLDEDLIGKARKAISNQSYAARAYDILGEGPEARALAPWVPADALGPLGERAFERASKSPMREGVPGLFTGDGYRSVVLPEVTDAARAALDETWVRGEQNTSGATVDAVAQSTLQLYFDNYEQRWSAMLADLRVRPSQSLAEATETTRILASQPSPIETLAKSVAKATDLRFQLPEQAQAAATGALGSVVSSPDPFARLRNALETPKQSDGGDEKPHSQLAALKPVLDTIYGQLSRATTSTAEVNKVFDVDSQLANANQSLLEEARRLPPPVDAWMVGVAADIGSLSVKTARSRLADQWAADGAELCSSIAYGRYPFDRRSDRDVAMSDFVRLFGPKGLFNSFFHDRLEPFVDTTASPWRWRGTFGTEGIPSEAIAQFENADKIRRAFFPSDSDKPSIAINIKSAGLGAGTDAAMLEIADDRLVDFPDHVQSKTLVWPSSQGTNISRIAFQPGGFDQAISKTGDWSIFRLLDTATITMEGQDLFRARFAKDNQYAEFDFQFGSVLNTFRLQALSDFKCPTQF